MSKKPLTNKAGEVRELSDSDFAEMRPVSEVLPDPVKTQQAGVIESNPVGRPRVENPKQPVTIRLSPEVTKYFRGTGKGWQTRVDKVLLEYVTSKDSE